MTKKNCFFSTVMRTKKNSLLAFLFTFHQFTEQTLMNEKKFLFFFGSILKWITNLPNSSAFSRHSVLNSNKRLSTATNAAYSFKNNFAYKLCFSFFFPFSSVLLLCSVWPFYFTVYPNDAQWTAYFSFDISICFSPFLIPTNKFIWIEIFRTISFQIHFTPNISL